MWIGSSLVFVAVGVVLVLLVDGDLGPIEHETIGWVLLGSGALSLVWAALAAASSKPLRLRRREKSHAR